MVGRLQGGQRGEQILRQSGTLVDDVPQQRGHRCGFSDVMEPTRTARPCCTMAVVMRQNATITVLDSARIFLYFLIGACLSRTYQRLRRYLFRLFSRNRDLGLIGGGREKILKTVVILPSFPNSFLYHHNHLINISQANNSQFGLPSTTQHHQVLNKPIIIKPHRQNGCRSLLREWPSLHVPPNPSNSYHRSLLDFSSIQTLDYVAFSVLTDPAHRSKPSSGPSASASWPSLTASAASSWPSSAASSPASTSSSASSPATPAAAAATGQAAPQVPGAVSAGVTTVPAVSKHVDGRSSPSLRRRSVPHLKA